jgi:threonine 3-dehydrogenase
LKAFAKLRPQPGIDLIDVERPKPGPLDVVVRVRAVSVCGTDYHIYRWDDWAREHVKPPRIIGHEFAGEIVETGNEVDSSLKGSMIAAESHIGCGTCYQCRTGNSHICERLAIVGVDVDGAFAEYVRIPLHNAWPIPREVPVETASILEPLGNAVHVVYATQTAGSHVAVFGCGPVGLSSITLAYISGALTVTAIDINDFRLKIAQQMGASKVINSTMTDPVEEIHKSTEGHGAGVVLEMSGNDHAIRQSFRVVRNGGTVVLFGIPSRDVLLNIADDIIFKETHVLGIVGREMFRTWYRLESLLKTGKLNLNPLITHRMKLENLEEAMALVGTGNCGKIVLTP